MFSKISSSEMLLRNLVNVHVYLHVPHKASFELNTKPMRPGTKVRLAISPENTENIGSVLCNVHYVISVLFLLCFLARLFIDVL